jgi:hypothetical protein
VADDGEVPEPPSEAGLTHAQAERLEQLQLGAEAMRKLKPQEVRALLLKAEGYSYKQIQEITGWTYTKVNRCLTEGRHAFRKRLAEIEGGAECERLAPLLSRLADGEASADDMTTLRPHLRTCLACRSALREYRRVPATAAALFPAAVFASSERPGFLELPARLVESLTGWAQKAHGIVEMASAQKVAAVAASTAAIAGGGAVGVKEIERQVAPKPKAASKTQPSAAAPEPVAQTPPAQTPAPTPTQAIERAPLTKEAQRRVRRQQRRQREAKRQRELERTTPPAQQEFDPAVAAGTPEPTSSDTSTSAAATPQSSAPTEPQTEPTPGGGAEEFAP